MITDFVFSPNHKAMLLLKDLVESSFCHLFCLCIVPSFLALKKKQKTQKNPTPDKKNATNQQQKTNPPQKTFM